MPFTPLSSPRIARLDLAYHDISRTDGLFTKMSERGLVERVTTDVEIFEATATFLYATHNNSSVWAMGFGTTPEAATMTAMTCAANRLHG